MADQKPGPAKPTIVYIHKGQHTLVFYCPDRRDYGLFVTSLCYKVRTQEGVPPGVQFTWFDAAEVLGALGEDLDLYLEQMAVDEADRRAADEKSKKEKPDG